MAADWGHLRLTAALIYRSIPVNTHRHPREAR